MSVDIRITRRRIPSTVAFARVLDAEPDAGEPDFVVASATLLAHPVSQLPPVLDDESWYLEYDV